MALMKCHECGAQIATSAKVCPQCGAKPKKKAGPLGWILALTFGFVLLAGIVGGNSGDRSPAATQPVAAAPAAKVALDPKVEKEIARMKPMDAGKFCSVELRRLKGMKTKPQPWYDAVKQVSLAFGITPDMLASIEGGGVSVGMPQCAALAAWGRPENINRTTTGSRTHEQWVYPGQHNYLYFDGDVLTSIQN